MSDLPSAQSRANSEVRSGCYSCNLCPLSDNMNQFVAFDLVYLTVRMTCNFNDITITFALFRRNSLLSQR